MGKREDIVLGITELCRKLKNGEIVIKDMPLNAILNMTAEAYNCVGFNGTEYASIYGNLLISCVEKRDIEALVNVIELALKDILIFPGIKERENELHLKTFFLQCKAEYYHNKEKLQKRYMEQGESNIVPFRGKGVIYSAITGGYDEVKEPEYISPDLDYILFTDNPNMKSDVWKIKLISKEDDLDNTRIARKIKILGYQYLTTYDFSIWVDGKLSIIGDLYHFVLNNRGKEPLLCFNHYINDCIYQEKKLCCSMNKDDPDVMNAQMERYRKEGYPEHNGLIDSGILVRELKNSKVNKLMDMWWNEVLYGSKRDQLSFNYVCWKNNFIYDTTDLYIYKNDYVKSYNHN